LSFYLDTSVLVAALTLEAATDRVQKWFDRQTVGTLSISDWVITEVASALSLKIRTGQISSEHRARVLTQFTRLAANSLLVLPVQSVHFHTAARFTDQADLGLRAADALHLAVAADHGLTVLTLDQKLAQAGITLGIETLMP
jgi:predicted nucleic acid-binding protein